MKKNSIGLNTSRRYHEDDISISQIARELNTCGVPTKRNGNGHTNKCHELSKENLRLGFLIRVDDTLLRGLMAIKKSQLYGRLWKSCNELRGSMDPSQYKNYILTLLFVKYVSDKDTLLDIPDGAFVPRYGKTQRRKRNRC